MFASKKGGKILQIPLRRQFAIVFGQEKTRFPAIINEPTGPAWFTIKSDTSANGFVNGMIADWQKHPQSVDQAHRAGQGCGAVPSRHPNNLIRRHLRVLIAGIVSSH